MVENKMASILRILGAIILILGFWGSLVFLEESKITTLVGIFSSSFVSILLFSFAEVIKLLQSNCNKNAKILSKVDELTDIAKEIQSNTNKSKYYSELDEIEDNLPKM